MYYEFYGNIDVKGKYIMDHVKWLVVNNTGLYQSCKKEDVMKLKIQVGEKTKKIVKDLTTKVSWDRVKNKECLYYRKVAISVWC